MKITSLVVALLLMPIAACLAVAADELSIEVTIDRDTVGLDEYANLQVVISGEEQNLPNPDMPNIAAFEMYSQGRSSSISIVNGQVNSSVSYRYLLMPKKAGTFVIDNIALVYKNKRYKGNPVNLTVLNTGTATSSNTEEQAVDQENGKGKDYFLEAVIDNKNPYVNEQVTLTLKFYIAIQYYGSPELSEPTTTGFWSELLGNRAPYRQVINNRKYKVIERIYALFPTQTGDLTIGRATIRVTVAGDNQQRDPFGMFSDFFNTGKEVAVSSNPIRINVKKLPNEGKPKDFTGSIGKFNIEASVDKKEVEVNQPVSLTIKISGTGNIKSAAEPSMPDMEDFRIYRASSNENVTKVQEKIGGTKVYEEVFIPKHPGNLEIPSLAYNYFDPETNQYKILSTKPISLRVIKPEGFVDSPNLPYQNPDLIVGSNARDIRYIKENIGDLKPNGYLIIETPLYLVVNGLPVLTLIGFVIYRNRKEKYASDISFARARQAGKIAKKRLSKAKSLANPGKGIEFFAEINIALTSYIADKLNISPHGLTTDQIKTLLLNKSADDNLINGITDTLKKCDFARFAPSSITQNDIDDVLAATEQHMIKLEGVQFA
ncbi:MAG: BatD family protein [bacterium]